MIGIIALLPPVILWLPNVLWKGVDILVAIIQAFIFALLTILYFGFALEPEEDDTHEKAGDKVPETVHSP